MLPRLSFLGAGIIPPFRKIRPSTNGNQPINDILVLHSVIGLSQGIFDAIERLTHGPYRVHAPDLYDGRAAVSIEEGFRIRREVGNDVVIARASQAAARLPPGSVYAGFSMGASIAARLAKADPSAAAVVMFHDVCSSEDWNSETSVQVHIADPDPWVPPGAAVAFSEEVSRLGPPADAFLYPGVGHLFSEPDVLDYDAAAAELAWNRTLTYLDRLHDG